MGHDRRKSPRLDVGPSERPDLIVLDLRSKPIPSSLLNLSRGGVGFLSKHSLNINDQVRATLLLPGYGSRIQAKGTIRHKEQFSGVYGYGVEWHLEQGAIEALADYLVLAISRE